MVSARELTCQLPCGDPVMLCMPFARAVHQQRAHTRRAANNLAHIMFSAHLRCTQCITRDCHITGVPAGLGLRFWCRGKSIISIGMSPST